MCIAEDRINNSSLLVLSAFPRHSFRESPNFFLVFCRAARGKERGRTIKKGPGICRAPFMIPPLKPLLG
jgi:hypothetical protein